MTAAVRDTSCCSSYCLTVCVSVFVHVTEQKATELTLWSLSDAQTPKSNIGEDAHIHLHNTTRDKHCDSPSLLSLPRLMRELLLLAEGLLLTPSRSQMIVFAAWGPDPTSPDPLTGTVEPFHQEFDIKTGRMIKRHPEHRVCIIFSLFFLHFFLFACSSSSIPAVEKKKVSGKYLSITQLMYCRPVLGWLYMTLHHEYIQSGNIVFLLNVITAVVLLNEGVLWRFLVN